MIKSTAQKFAPPPKLTTTEWADQHRFLSQKATALPGRYSSTITPYIAGIHEALDDPRCWKVVGMKSAQIAWTDGVVNNYIGRRIDIDPCPILIMFPKEGAAKEYNTEKFEPMVESTPRLADKVDITKSRKADNRQLFKNFPGGFLKMVGANSPSSVKSTPAPVAIVEEPDDCTQNLRGQGDAIKLFEERTKTYSRRKVVLGGTPSIKGLSNIEAEYSNSDRRKYYVPCHDCGQAHVLDWDHVVWDDDPGQSHELYGSALPVTARYVCPHCGSIWNDIQKNRNVRKGEWRAEKPFNGVAGFYINELYSPFPGSKLSRLVERYLEACYHRDQGDESEIIVFINSALGKAYEYESDAPEHDELEAKAIDYAELTVPQGGLIITAGVDVQGDRLAVVIRAWGRDEESWLLYWGQLYGNPIDKLDPVWDALDKVLFQGFRHSSGATLGLIAASIDASDGNTNDAVYHYVRARQHKGVMAIKGASEQTAEKEIYSPPKANIDNDAAGKKRSKADRYGIKPYIVGTQKAKDLISNRIKLEGVGGGRMHWYKNVPDSYYEQITSEVKAPSPRNPKKKVWQKKSGVRNEAWDCEVYALHASRRCKVHLLKPQQWDEVEKRVLQSDLFSGLQGSQSVSYETKSSGPAEPKQSRRLSAGVEL